MPNFRAWINVANQNFSAQLSLANPKQLKEIDINNKISRLTNLAYSIDSKCRNTKNVWIIISKKRSINK